jgi:hypothetical protein
LAVPLLVPRGFNAAINFVFFAGKPQELIKLSMFWATLVAWVKPKHGQLSKAAIEKRKAIRALFELLNQIKIDLCQFREFRGEQLFPRSRLTKVVFEGMRLKK